MQIIFDTNYSARKAHATEIIQLKRQITEPRNCPALPQKKIYPAQSQHGWGSNSFKELFVNY